MNYLAGSLADGVLVPLFQFLPTHQYKDGKRSSKCTGTSNGKSIY